MRRGVFGTWPAVAVLSALAAGTALFISWTQWGGYEADAVLAVQGGDPEQASAANTEILAFVSSLSSLPGESPAGPSWEAPGTAFRVSLETPRVTLTTCAESADVAIGSANRSAETAVTAWNRQALDRERARINSLETKQEKLTADLAGLREKEAGFRANHPGIAASHGSSAITEESDRLARELAETERSLAYLEGQRDRLEQEVRLLDAESDEEYLARTDPAVSAAATRLRDLRRELHDLRRRYTERNPLVESTLRRIEEEEEVYRSALEAARKSPDTLEPPRERVLRSELAAVAREMEGTRGKLERLRAEMKSVEKQASVRPVLEKQMEEFARSETAIEESLDAVRDKHQRYVALASSGTGFLPRLRIETPASSARITGAGKVAAAGIASAGVVWLLSLLALAGRRERRRESAEQLAARLGVPVLAVFPRRH
jgi:predicted  nucleic acid-binding Zn-ribbon protein